MVSDKVESRLEDIVEESSKDIEWAKAEYGDALKLVEDRVEEEITEERKVELALGVVQDGVIYDDRVTGGEEMELEVLAIGQGGQVTWNKETEDEKDHVYGYGFVFGPLREDGGDKAARAVMIHSEDHVDLSEVQRKYHARNTLRSTYAVRESNDLDGVYRCETTNNTDPVEGELDSLPSDPDEKNDILRQTIPEATLATIHEDLSAYDPESDGNYTYDFGADLRRIEARIVDYYVPNDRSWGRYTIMDDSVTPDDLGPDVVDSDQNVPGLTVWADPDYHMEYGRKTRADFYGTVEEGKNGQIQMNLVGVVPILPMPMEDERADSDTQTKKKSI